MADKQQRGVATESSGQYDARKKWAYIMGVDCALHGPNLVNCHFTIFATPAMTAAWERGKADAESFLQE